MAPKKQNDASEVGILAGHQPLFEMELECELDFERRVREIESRWSPGKSRR